MSDTKTVVLPSGLEVRIRRPGVRTIQAVFRCLPMLGREPDESGQQITTTDDLEATIALVCGCCVAPRFTSDAGADDARDIEDLDMADFTALAQAVNEYADLQREADAIRPLSATGKAS